MSHEDVLLIVNSIKDIDHTLTVIWICLMSIMCAVWFK